MNFFQKNKNKNMKKEETKKVSTKVKNEPVIEDQPVCAMIYVRRDDVYSVGYSDDISDEVLKKLETRTVDILEDYYLKALKQACEELGIKTQEQVRKERERLRGIELQIMELEERKRCILNGEPEPEYVGKDFDEKRIPDIKDYVGKVDLEKAAKYEEPEDEVCADVRPAGEKEDVDTKNTNADDVHIRYKKVVKDGDEEKVTEKTEKDFTEEEIERLKNELFNGVFTGKTFGDIYNSEHEFFDKYFKGYNDAALFMTDMLNRAFGVK